MPEMVASILSDSFKRERVLSLCDASDVLRDAFSQTESSLNHHYEVFLKHAFFDPQLCLFYILSYFSAFSIVCYSTSCFQLAFFVSQLFFHQILFFEFSIFDFLNFSSTNSCLLDHLFKGN